MLLKVISLDRTPKRFVQFLAWNPGFEFERIPAVDGTALTRESCIQDGLITSSNSYSAGALGNAMSHTSLWRECAAGSMPFHILEDDVVLRHDFSSMVERLLDHVPDWDIVLWTSNFDWPLQAIPAPGVGPVIFQFDPKQALQGLDEFSRSTGQPILLKLLSAASTGCYSISPKGAARILKDCLPVSDARAMYVTRPGVYWDNGALDVELCRHYQDWHAYIAFPPLAVAPNDQSSSVIRGHLETIHDPVIANRIIA